VELELGVLTGVADEVGEREVPAGVVVVLPGRVDPPPTEEEPPEELPFKQELSVEVWTGKGADC